MLTRTKIRQPVCIHALLFAGLLCSAPAVAMQFETCLLSDAHQAVQREALCGHLEVAENRGARNGRKLSLHVALIESPSEKKSTPLYFLPGGPGQAASLSYVKLAPVLKRLAGNRDIVLLDQRGSGKSSPLECDAPDNKLDATPEAMTQWAGQCLAQLQGDTRFYTTAAAVADLEAVRLALGHERINLYGVSYGTRLALEYMREHGDRVRSAILDGIAGFDYVIGEDAEKLGAAALDAQFERCERDARCKQRFPDLRRAYHALLDKFKSEPVTVSVAHPSRGEPREVELTRLSLYQLARTLLYSTDFASLLPLLLHEAHAGGDYRRLAAQSLYIDEALIGDISYPLYFSVVCAEDVPGYSLARTHSDTPGEISKRAIQAVCARWPHASGDEIKLRDSYPIAPPVLMLSGRYDPVTPPEQAEKLKAHARNAEHFVVEEAAHNVLVTRCPLRIARTFLHQASFEDLPTQCLEHSTPAPFFIDLHGPAS